MYFNIRKFILCLLTWLICISIIAQTNKVNSFRSEEDSIKNLFRVIIKSHNDNIKAKYALRIDSLFSIMLSHPESYDYTLDSLTTIGKIFAPDHSFRIITWNLALEDGTYKYYGYIQKFNITTKGFKYFHLNDCKENIKDMENTILNADKWFGSLYYYILKEKAENTEYYTLLSLQYYNMDISRKIIEILYFNEDGKPVFGAPVIMQDNTLKDRIVFQYSAHVQMNLRFDKKLKMIVFDHLSPTEQRYSGEYEYYGPDLSYDALEFKDNKWIYHSDIDLRQPGGKKQ